MLSCEGVQHEAWISEEVLCTTLQKADLHQAKHRHMLLFSSHWQSVTVG